MKNAIINGFRLKDLLNILDARANVTIFTGITTEDKVSKDAVKVYELLADKDFMNNYGKKDVTGLVSFMNVTHILIEEA